MGQGRLAAALRGAGRAQYTGGTRLPGREKGKRREGRRTGSRKETGGAERLPRDRAGNAAGQRTSRAPAPAQACGKAAVHRLRFSRCSMEVLLDKLYLCMQTYAAARKYKRGAMSYTIKEFGRGRICVAHDALREEDRAAAVRAFLEKVEGVTRVETDGAAATLLLEYDPSRLGHGDLFQLARRLEALVAEKR